MKQSRYIINMEDNKTIVYYDNCAQQYFESTVNTDMSVNCDRFLQYVKPGGVIIDIGAGSGRDILYFMNKGYRVEGIDAAPEMCRIASEYTGVPVICCKIQEWVPDKKYGGIWANASLLHLSLKEIEEFILRVDNLLEDQGVIYISLKSGIETGTDVTGRYFTNFTEEKVQQIVSKNTAMEVVDSWKTGDELQREEFVWLNLILRKN